jgi:hypothetical protein
MDHVDWLHCSKTWIDPWLVGNHLSELASEVVIIVPAQRRRQLTVAVALSGMSWVRDIRGALTIPVLVQYVILFQQLQTVQLVPGVADQLDWRWPGA